jgi:hypothetical protein
MCPGFGGVGNLAVIWSGCALCASPAPASIQRMTSGNSDPSGTRFGDGDTVIRRDTHAHRVWTASPHRVLADNGSDLTLAYWPGITSWAPKPWIAWTRDRDPAARADILPSLAAGRWDLDLWTWQDTLWVSLLRDDELFTVNLFADPQHGPRFWYLNFQRPFTRTKIGIDTFDLFLDLVLDPDLSRPRWKDEAEYQQARRLGIIDEATYRQIEAARERALALTDGPLHELVEQWEGLRLDPSWPIPTLTPDALTLSTGYRFV